MDDRQKEDLVFGGVERKDAGDLDGAIALWRRFLDNFEESGEFGPDPNWVTDTYYNIADAYEGQGKLDKAVQALESALTIKPDEADFLFNYGMFCGRLGRHKDVATAFRRFLKFHSNARDAHLVRTALQNSEMMIARGKSEVDTGIQDSSFESRYNAGAELLNTGQFERAGILFEELLKEPFRALTDELMCRFSLCQIVLRRTGAQTLRECVSKLTQEDATFVSRHSEAIMAIKSKLSKDDLSQQTIDSAWKLADSLILGLMSWDEAEQPSERENKSGFFKRTSGRS